MVDDEFKKIEDFLKFGDNLELKTFKKFEELSNILFEQKFKDDSKEGFLSLNQLLYEIYGNYDKNNNETIKDLSIIIIVIKKLLLTLQNTENYDIIEEEDKKTYLSLIKILLEEFIKDINSNLNFFNEFLRYTNDLKNLLNIED